MNKGFNFTDKNEINGLNKVKAFTLVEVLVAMTIFSMVIVMSASTFTSSSNVNRKISGSSLIQEKISVFLDQMLGDIRQAKYASFSSDSTKNILTVVIPDPEHPEPPEDVDYNITKIYTVNKSGTNITSITVTKNIGTDTSGTPQTIDMTGVKVSNFEFSGNGVTNANDKTIDKYPFIKVTATFASSIDNTVPEFPIETIMTLRNFKKVYNESF